MARVTGVSRNPGQANPLDQGNIEEPPLTRKNAMVSFQFSRKSNEGFGPFGFGADSLSWRSYSPWLVGPEDTTTSFVGNVGTETPRIGKWFGLRMLHWFSSIPFYMIIHVVFLSPHRIFDFAKVHNFISWKFPESWILSIIIVRRQLVGSLTETNR